MAKHSAAAHRGSPQPSHYLFVKSDIKRKQIVRRWHCLCLVSHSVTALCQLLSKLLREDTKKKVMDLLKLIMDLSNSMYFLPFAKQNQTEVWPRLLLKLLLWTKGQSTQCLGSIVPLAMFFKWFFLLNICLDNQNGKASRMRSSSKRGRSYPNSAKQDSRGAVGYQRSERRYLDK